MPHVAPHFRGLTVTTNLYLSRKMTREEVMQRFHHAYDAESLVHVVDEAPWVSAVAGKHHVDIGGFSVSVDGKRVVVVATLDNLLKGAATQALQNINRAIGVDELTAIKQE
jgi:N-acetyl-gamma-glutamyl-phosphate reductase